MFDYAYADDDSGQGVDVASAVDINGDGCGDGILAGSQMSDVVFDRDAGAGGTFGASFDVGTLDGTNGFVLTDDRGAVQHDWTVAAAGDINGDGIDDLLVGAYLSYDDGEYLDRVYLVYGKDTATQGDFAADIAQDDLDGTDGLIFTGDDESLFTGVDIAGAGDLNGDGIDDIVITTRANYTKDAFETFVVYGGVDNIAAFDSADGLLDGMLSLGML